MDQSPMSSLRSKLLPAVWLVTAAVLPGCLPSDNPTDSTALASNDAPYGIEQAVIDRSQERWQSMVAGDIETVYQYNSPAYRSMTSMQRFQSQLGSSIEWIGAEVVSAECQADRCIVRANVSYRLPARSGTHTREISETWIRSDGEWWIHTRR